MSEENFRLYLGAQPLVSLLGYLNFAEGKPDTHFQKHLHDAYAGIAHESASPWVDLGKALRAALHSLHQSELPAFRDISQARAVLALIFDEVMPAYRRHHQDLLAHLSDAQLWQPFLIARVAEAVLSQGGPWNERDRIVGGALRQLNDFVGHRPIAVLENGRQGEVYGHERVRPIPLYLGGVGVSQGRYASMIDGALDLIGQAPPELRREAGFDPNLLDELAVDPRGYDFSHPVDKRPNYCFGEWDPHHLDGQGRYRRFVLRAVTLEGLWQRVQSQSYQPLRDEFAYEAAAVLAATMLMASAVSGAGPDFHDSTVTLTTLVPRVAALREKFYQNCLRLLPGTHGERLREEARTTRQAFGGARMGLNQHLARCRALHLQRRHLALLLADLGYPAAARRQLGDVAAASVRLLAEMQILLTAGQLHLERGELAEAAQVLPQVEDLLRRGIACGALMDPWNILGFQGNYPRFFAVEDTIRDPRVHDLIRVMDGLFNLHAHVMSEGAAAGTFSPSADLAKQMRRLAAWWDAFATTTVSDIPHVSGKEATESAELVAQALGQWRDRGSATADLAFWRDQLERFHAPKSFAMVVDALLRKEDLRAAMALLSTWLGQAADVALEDGDHSFHQLALRWMLGLCAQAGLGNERLRQGEPPAAPRLARPVPLAIKFFDYLEANAEDFWHVPRLDILSLGDAPQQPPADGDDQEESSLFGAAYEDVTYKDSTDDDVESEVLDFMPQKDFDLAHEAERLEGRLRFLSTVSRLWNIATRVLRLASDEDQGLGQEALKGWLSRARHNIHGLLDLLDAIHDHEIPRPSGSFESMAEYNNRRVAKERLLGLVIATCLDHALAVGALRGSLAAEGTGDEATAGPAWEKHILQLERALVRGDATRARAIIRGFIPAFRDEPLLYTPLASGGHPRNILRSSLAQTILRSLGANLPRVGLVRETVQILRMAHEMEQAQPLSGPRITEFDRLYHLGLQGAAEAVTDAALRENKRPENLVNALEYLLEPFLGIWMDHSKTLRVAMLEVVSTDSEWKRVVDFIKRFGKDLFTPRFLSLGNLEAVLSRGVAAFLDYLVADEEAGAQVRLAAELDRSVSRNDAERLLLIILQAIRENYDSFKDYMSTTAQSDFGDNLYQYLDLLRLKASYDRNAWQFRPLSMIHEVLARKHGEAAGLWREQVQQICQRNAEDHLRELAALEAKHGIRLPTIRDRLEERFVQPMALDRLCALVEPALENANAFLGKDAVIPLEIELRPFAEKPVGVGLDVPGWILRLEGELQRAKTSRSALVTLAETLFQVPRVPVPFDDLTRELKDWRKS